MKKVFLLAPLVVLLALQGYAQHTPTVEMFGGYSHDRILSAGSGEPVHSNGWEASANWNLNHWFGLKADFDGSYCCHQQYLYSFLGGPQLSLRKEKYTFFVHGLFGGAHAKGLVTTDTNLAWALGGGVDWNVHRVVAIRLPQVDYFGTRFVDGTQNDLRLSGGLVFRFGRK